MVDRKTPKAVAAEQSILGSVLIEEAALLDVVDKIHTPAVFSVEIHRLIWESIISIHEKNQPVDFITISQELGRRGQLEEIGGIAYINAMIEACPSARNVLAYIEPVMKAYTQRRLLEASQGIVSTVHRQDIEAEEMLAQSEMMIGEISKELITAESYKLSDLLIDQQKRIMAAVNSPNGARGIPSGFILLDHMTNGFKPTELITLAGASSMGKSALASQIAFNALINSKYPVLIFSLEMSKEQWLDRMVAGEARIEGHRLRNGDMSDDEWRRLLDTRKRIESLPLFIIDTPELTSREIKAQSRQFKAKYGGVAMVVIDYLQISDSAEKIQDERLRVTRLVRDYKSLARYIEAPVLCLSQVTRGVNQRENKRPMLSDLRETSAIEAESDIVMFVYRPNYYLKKLIPPDQWSAADAEPDEIILGKQRNGPTGIIQVKFLEEYARFENLSMETP